MKNDSGSIVEIARTATPCIFPPGYVSPRRQFSLVSKEGMVERSEAPPIDLEKKLELVHAYCVMLRLAFDQATLLQSEHRGLLDNPWTLHEAFRMAEHKNDVCFGSPFIDRVSGDTESYDADMAAAYSTARQAFAASPVYNGCDSGFCARCYMIEITVSLADMIFVRLTGYHSRVCDGLLDGIHRSCQRVASAQRTCEGGRLADMSVPTAILKRIFEKEVGNED